MPLPLLLMPLSPSPVDAGANEACVTFVATCHFSCRFPILKGKRCYRTPLLEMGLIGYARQTPQLIRAIGTGEHDEQQHCHKIPTCDHNDGTKTCLNLRGLKVSGQEWVYAETMSTSFALSNSSKL
ncbi:hypothetical protein F2P81_009542 [Scophthalmus maximus]|uniref:Uncharacterized protein n=1 Tax=Scophthalmus maximus TaxID=52904 RepID=A0A6A4T3Z4_SCOMX|nr:hypothetical protein F2P81_009542 [Scophthalmus maximus]